MFINYWRYYWRAKTKYDVHSPFVFELLEAVIEDQREFYVFEEIEDLRQDLLREKMLIEVTDLGAGSHTTATNRRSISSIARSAVTPPRYAQLLFKLVHHLKPKTLLEMGTSLGVSTLYQAKALEKSRMITLEGCPQISSIAMQNFEDFDSQNIELITGNFDQTLPVVLQELERLDYAFIDGNHRKAPTLNYFEKCLEYAHENSVFVFDDVYWSDEMCEAWAAIKAHPKVTISLDLFYMGIVFFRTENAVKEHFTLIDAWKKPWRFGFFS